jgi:enoyl-CoA hydratase
MAFPPSVILPLIMIEIDHLDGVAILRMADGKANAMSLEFCERLVDSFQKLDHWGTSAVVVTGQARIFSAGVDLLRLVDGGIPYIRKFLPALTAMLATVFSFPRPVVAAVNGHAIAGGCVLACAADHRLMAHDAGRIGVTELAVGVPFPCVALEIMRCATSPRHFEDTIFSAATYTPEQAVERGLINEIAAADELLPRAIAHAKTLAALPASAFALTKRQTRALALERIAKDAEREEIDDIWTAPETLSRIRAYVARTLRKS